MLDVREIPMRAHWTPLDPRRCHCGGWLVAETDGNGRTLQRCNTCTAQSSIVRMPAQWLNEPAVVIASTADLALCPCGRGRVKTVGSGICLACDNDAKRIAARARNARRRAAGRAA